MTSIDLDLDLDGALTELRAQAPLVQCLTNIVVANWTANVLLAAGASPAMVDNPTEAALFAGLSGGVLVNLGTPYAETAAAMRAAVAAAGGAQRPWVLDPVAAGGLPWRTALALEFVELSPPAIIRGNASEVLGLAGRSSGGRGADASDSVHAAAEAAAELATRYGCVVAVSGPTDLITDGRRSFTVANGHPWMTRVTGVGCGLGALMAAFAAVSDDGLQAAVAATALLTIAAEQAAAITSGPGTFAPVLLDQLSLVTSAQLAASARLGDA
jgi:hydroxyethylthiazole kinase